MSISRLFKPGIPVLLMVCIGFSSCEEGESPVTKISGEYFPMEDNIQWSYQQWWLIGDLDPMDAGVVHWKISGDTLMEGKSYKKIVDADNGQIIKIVRKEGARYFGRNHDLYLGFKHEYVFLDMDVPVGGSWFYYKDDGATKTEYVVKSIQGTQSMDGIVYENVLELEVNYYNQVSPGVYELSHSSKHQYAKDIGEVYNFYPYPASNVFADVVNFLTDYQK